MSKGIIVVGGTEEEHYNLLGEDRLRPIINLSLIHISVPLLIWDLVMMNTTLWQMLT